MKKSKKAMALALIGALMILPACGQNNAQVESSAQDEANVLDLTGSWEAETHGSDYYLAGYIKDGLIELHWVSDSTGVGSVYWAGTYVASEGYQDPYSWTSKKDTAIMSTSAYAASEDERTFTYSDGKITLEASDQSGSYAVTLVRSTVDYTTSAVEVTEEQKKAAEKEDAAKEEVDNAEAAADEETKNVKLVDSGYSVTKSGNGGAMLYYAAEIANPNKYNAITSPIITISVRDKDGGIITKQQKVLAGLAPKERLTFGDCLKCDSGDIGEVEITVKNKDYDIKAAETAGVGSVKDLEILKSEQRKGDNGAVNFTGTVKNKTDVDRGNVVITVVYLKEGKIVGGATEFIDALAANSEAEFTVTDKGGLTDYDSYEIYATQEA